MKQILSMYHLKKYPRLKESTNITFHESNSIFFYERFRTIRSATVALCIPLENEDFVVSTMEDVSPTKWHLAHTSWFFETFVLRPYLSFYEIFSPHYAFLFNSYYEQIGTHHYRAQRGLMSRPTVQEIFAYRDYVDQAVEKICEEIAEQVQHPGWAMLELGLHHEQQHQELLLTDIKHVFWSNLLRPSYLNEPVPIPPVAQQGWQRIDEGIYTLGNAGEQFAFDNERPAHKTFVQASQLAHRLVTNEEYKSFIADGGYKQPRLWLSNGWSIVQTHKWESPLYWERYEGEWYEFTLSGTAPLILSAPVCHISYYEADAFARWAGYRLPTEAEWEVVAAKNSLSGRFVEHGVLHPSADEGSSLQQLFGDVWQWTQSAYIAYPGFHPSPGAIGEYNGKFMCDQWVLRGASCVTPRSHARYTYRNFFPSATRWQFTGIRLAAST